jgi:hypothetical protein
MCVKLIDTPAQLIAKKNYITSNEYSITIPGSKITMSSLLEDIRNVQRTGNWFNLIDWNNKDA